MPSPKLLLSTLLLATVGCATEAPNDAAERLLTDGEVLKFEKVDDDVSFVYEIDLVNLTISGTRIEKAANGMSCVSQLPQTSLAQDAAQELVDALDQGSLITSTEDTCSLIPDLGSFGVTIDGVRFSSTPTPPTPPSCKQLIAPSTLESQLTRTFEALRPARLEASGLTFEPVRPDRLQPNGPALESEHPNHLALGTGRLSFQLTGRTCQ